MTIQSIPNLHASSNLQIIGSTHQAVRMICSNAVSISEDVCAYVSGIRIGVNRVEGEFEPGDIIEYPISYLPWVDLPVDVRFVSERTGQEVADPFRISTHDDAVALVGMGEAVIQSVAIDQGMIRGLVVNRVNGLLRPQMFARINGVLPRAITVEPPRLLDDGGASFQFSAQLHPSDLGENGLTAEIFLLGKDTPLTSIAFRRADVDDLTKRIVEFEARMAQITQSTALRFKTMSNETTQRLDMLQQRIDSFIEYSASFMFDRVAATEVASAPGAEPLDEALRGKVDAFLDLVRTGGASRIASPPGPVSVSVPLASGAFSFGWHDVEEEGGTAFRWMSDNAVIFNPQPDRPVSEVRIALSAVHGTSQPVIRAAFDQTPVALVIERAKKKAAGWRIILVPPEEGAAATFHALSLASMLNAPPARIAGRSARQISVAVSELVFVYAA